MSLEGVTVISHQILFGTFQLANACHAFLITKSRGLGISVGLFCVELQLIGEMSLSISLF